MHRRAVLIVLLALLAGLCSAQLKLRLEFPASGSYLVWTGTKAPEGRLPETTRLEGASGEISPTAFGPGDKLFVIDESTGNLASKGINQISGSWKIAPSEFNRIGELKVRVVYEGDPVEAANVTISSGKESKTQLIGASDQGEASFFGLPAGSVKVSVSYKTVDGETPDPYKQSNDVALKRSEPVPTLTISLPKETTVVKGGEAATPAGSTKAEGKAEEPKERGGIGFLGQLITFLLALAIAVLAVWFGLQWLKKNQDAVQGKLSKLGVEIPGQNPEPPSDAVAPQRPIAPAPPEKIILGDSAPDPVAAPIVTPVATITGEPRLVSVDGDSLPLDEGVLTVGRDAGMGLSLLEESTVSRRHAEIERQGSSVKVRDLGSTNGTFVNGVQVQGEADLRPGDQVQFGAVRFRFEG